VELSSLYFDILKDRLYTAATRSKGRRSAQTALYRLTYALVRLLAPLMSFTTEEVWGHLRKLPGAPASVHLELLPEPDELIEGLTPEDRKRAENWDRLMEIRATVLKSLEAARKEKFIGAPLEAHLHLQASGAMYPLLENYAAKLPELFIVSQVSIEGRSETELSVHVERAAGEKCPRCWKYQRDIGVNPELPQVCGACAGAITENRKNAG
jgi:isoleucyl-tRNA synthetase